MSDDKLMADPYASPSASTGALPSPAAAMPSSDLGSAVDGYSGAFHLPTQPAPIPTPDFLFEDSYDESFRRSWGERLTYHVGCAYLVGLTSGGASGFYQGLRSSAGERQRIRVNAVLNQTGKLGPGLANSLGCVAMMCSIFESLAYNIRGTDDLLNPVGAAALTGTLYRITDGPVVAGRWAAGLAAVVGAGSLAAKEISKRGILKNFL